MIPILLLTGTILMGLGDSGGLNATVEAMSS